MEDYVLWDDVILRYSHLDQLGGGSEKVKETYITPAEHELHGRLSSRYTVPFSSTNITAKDLVIELVRIRAGLGKERRMEKVVEAFDLRIARLISGAETMMISSSNGNIASITPDAGNAVWASNADYHPTFGHGDERDFVVSSQMLQDEQDERGIY